MVLGGSMFLAFFRNACCTFLLLAGTAGLAGATPSASEDKIIESLIQRVAARANMVFLRNGNEYSAADAARHMREKYEYFKQEIVTAEDFILRCGTRSEMTKVTYKVRMAGGNAVRESSDFLYEELRALRQR
ncbi:DUF5329 family protein [Variovorax sp. J22G21]|uniref:DUF5329 family protein n=1 Tax=Variovorax fucosicus TaxID=3053517 RepID=UPI002576CDCC|nr:MULTISPECIES: DUF5329 family protein [unclassified Variovorax]MDM0038339.1 DUF5329 family protein [Variovorax sp. J22R193]MDM0063115.1 DUF5329 family protein [Variovorax sp. J22G21]